MVFYVDKNGTAIHESDTYIYKGEPYTKEDVKAEITKDGKEPHNWGLD